MTVKEIYSYIDSIAPFATAADWDNSGFLCGDINAEVTKAIVALDATFEEIIQAQTIGANLIITHHPVIFHPQKNFLTGNVCFEATKRDISILCAHTNLDKTPGGVNDTLCKALNMDYHKENENIYDGFLNIGYLPVKGTAKKVAEYISEKLSAAVRYTDTEHFIEKTAVCSGAGADAAQEAARLGCNALITGDASYHDFLNAKELGITLFAAGHFETEIVIVPELIKLLSKNFPGIEFIPAERKNPVITVI